MLQQQIHDRLKKEYAENVLKVRLFEITHTCMSEQPVYEALDGFGIDML